MPPLFPSALAISRFDGRKLLVIMTILAVALTVESQIGIIADFIPEQLASNQGIAVFIGIWAIFIAMQYYILEFVKYNNKNSRARTPYLHLIHKILTVAQFLLAGIIALVILQVLLVREYNSVMLYIVLSISYGLWIVTLGLLGKALFSWYRVKKNLMVLLFALSMVFYVINGVFGLYGQLEELAKRNLVIEYGDVAIFPESPSPVLVVYQTASSIAYILTWIATIMLLRPYIEKLGKLKFWSIMGATMVYYLIQFPLFTLGYFTPSENSNAMANILTFSLSAIFSGIIFGVAFLSVARVLKIGTAARNYMIIAAYGFLLFYIAGSALVLQAAYPPYGLVSVSFTGLSCYLIYNGLYFSAISVSQDMTLRQSIRKSVMEQSKLLDSIGTAEMEREVQKQVLTVAKKASASMEEESGIEASMNEVDMKEYLELVIRELSSK
ncbi:MAG: hypothetical protein QN718_11310 [Nitrososphaeraceae archaeon]|nr:hypothetical protein [Nitrososphaeraceae archaeon]MDW0216961.1 hypothetical protein [Nitrososphaeraceae archaeon]MDW0225938.1 hypothetical protein [Nitrososphaeraceae archaeon]MDW0230126.1 hypothetical protein [Nitrososphaeraceae archaeon]MDW0283314.1 hypothetical protein [Nitrososphaeraceae archaeon]